MLENQDAFNDGRDSLLQFLWGKRKMLIIVPLAVGIITAVISLFLTPLFKSSAIVFPTATSTVSYSEQRNAKASAMDFGEEEQAEQLVQILQSSRIRNKIVNRFNLMEHYEIDKDDKNKYFKLGKAWENHIKFTRTRYGSIQIDVWDRDKELAAEIANKIVDLIDTVKNNMVKERTIPAFEISQRKRDMLQNEMTQLTSQLDSLSKIGVVPVEGRANLFQAYNEAKTSSDKAFFQDKIDVNIKYGATYDGLAMLRDERIVKLTKFEDAYEQAESDANTNLNHKFVVEPAVVADKKDKPKRSILVILAAAGSFFFLAFFYLIREKIAELKSASAH